MTLTRQASVPGEQVLLIPAVYNYVRSILRNSSSGPPVHPRVIHTTGGNGMSEGELGTRSSPRDLAAKAESFVDDISTLEGRTFSMASTQIGSLAEELDLWPDQELADKLRLRAYTRIDFDCDDGLPSGRCE